MRYSKTESSVEGGVNVYGKGCHGCQNRNADIMLSYANGDKHEGASNGITTVYDLFLTTEQAVWLRDNLTKELEFNTKKEKK